MHINQYNVDSFFCCIFSAERVLGLIRKYYPDTVKDKTQTERYHWLIQALKKYSGTRTHMHVKLQE
jgi:hypothetical protein